MVRIRKSDANRVDIEYNQNLDAVTSATTGDAIDMGYYSVKAVFIVVSGNTGAVTITIQANHDGTNWMDLNSKTYTATNGYDVFHYTNYYPFMRTKTSTQSSSTVSTVITGKS